MSLTVWWTISEDCLFKAKGPGSRPIPVLRLDEVRAVVAHLASKYDKDSVYGWDEGYVAACYDILAQLKGVGDE